MAARRKENIKKNNKISIKNQILRQRRTRLRRASSK